MAKKQKDEPTAAAKRSADGDVLPPPTTPAAPVGAAVEIARPAGVSVSRPASSGWIEPVGETVATTLRTVRDLLPSRLPVFLGTTALLVAGVIDAPAALGVGLAFEALRRWEPATAR
ncbi:hypothetical protein [Actinomycetospora chiangmaiensis]|uniref:hypothetical protein n=1 Tax=Actinomycetospora chiangmaiensis TaxID=402650 RepID=UPI0003687C20|nr:hypothetical protein [Actinomycetospora chiangmaiensis]